MPKAVTAGMPNPWALPEVEIGAPVADVWTMLAGCQAELADIGARSSALVAHPAKKVARHALPAVLRAK